MTRSKGRRMSLNQSLKIQEMQIVMETKTQRKRANKKAKEKAVAALAKGMSTMAIGAMAQRAPKKRKRVRKPRTSASGEIVVRRKELLFEVKAGDTAEDLFKKFTVSPRKFTWLQTLSKAFEKYQWSSLRFMWKPAVGTVVGGLVTMGMRWDTTDQDPAARTDIVAHTPNITHAIWEDGERKPLVLPADKLQTRRWYIMNDKGSDGGPGQLEVGVTSAATKQVLGEVWAEYTVRMSGTQA